MGLTRSCSVFGCGQTMPCPRHSRRRTEQKSFRERGYSSRWTRLSRQHLARFPCCGDRAPGAPETTDSICRAEGRVVQANVTDHIAPHRGDHALMWSPLNHQSLCFSCHGKKSRRERQSG